MAATTAVVRVGVGCIVKSSHHPNCVLLGTRLSSHGEEPLHHHTDRQLILHRCLLGHGKVALPGGYLELNETWEECAVREIKEETNLDIENIQFVHVTNDRCIDGSINKHYITIFVSGSVKEPSAPLMNMEPHKCAGWEWTPWSSIIDIFHSDRSKLFDPLRNFISDGKSAP